VAIALAAVMTYALIDGFEDAELPGNQVQTTAEVSDSIFSTYLVPFEVVSVLLLAALIGAIVLARRD
jgi:NADH-quinone oxidoreductase subunit J